MPLPSLTKADLLAIEREYCQRSLSNFIKRAWHVLEPGQPYVHGWHIDAIAEHLSAVTAGQITRLAIAVPPGTMKSLATAVFFPAWEWGPKGLAATRTVAASHSEALSIRDNIRARRLIQSEWFQSLWPMKLVGDQNAKGKFENEATGFRQATAFGSLTGSRGDRVILDDVMSVDDAGSEAKRESILTTFFEAVPTRLNNPDRSAIITIMQRLHERDVIGAIEARGMGYEMLVLPMEFEPERRCVTSIGFKDPRTEDGQLLFPDRFPAETLQQMRNDMGSYAWAGQMQQRPAPRDAGLFRRAWFEIVPAVPAGGKTVRSWDLAATVPKGTSDPDYTVGLRMTEVDDVFYVDAVERLRGSPADVERTIVNTAHQDGKRVRIRLPEDPGQAGKAQGKYLIGKLKGYNARSVRESGDKVTRANPVSAQAEAGNVKLVQGPWIEKFLDEVCMFPNGAHDDQVDALSGAFDALANSAYDYRIAL